MTLFKPSDIINIEETLYYFSRRFTAERGGKWI